MNQETLDLIMVIVLGCLMMGAFVAEYLVNEYYDKKLEPLYQDLNTSLAEYKGSSK